LLKTEDRTNALKELFEIEVNTAWFNIRKWRLAIMEKGLSMWQRPRRW